VDTPLREPGPAGLLTRLADFAGTAYQALVQTFVSSTKARDTEHHLRQIINVQPGRGNVCGTRASIGHGHVVSHLETL